MFKLVLEKEKWKIKKKHFAAPFSKRKKKNAVQIHKKLSVKKLRQCQNWFAKFHSVEKDKNFFERDVAKFRERWRKVIKQNGRNV